jgi:hopanoid biosynthesis associated protein HpnK
MVGAAATRDAVRRARELPALRVGLHLVLTRGRPILSPAEVQGLVDPKGRFRDDLVRAGFRYFFFPSVRRQLEKEIRAQFSAFRDTGLPLDHVNVHNHLQLHPTVLGLVLKVGRDFGLTSFRIPYEPFLPSWRAAGEGIPRRFLSWLFLFPWSALGRLRLKRDNVFCNDYLFGMHDTGRMGKDRLLRLLSHLPPGVSEAHFHLVVGRSQPDPELEALTSGEVAEAMRAAGIESVCYSDLGRRGR